jgi:hypothetical protein
MNVDFGSINHSPVTELPQEGSKIGISSLSEVSEQNVNLKAVKSKTSNTSFNYAFGKTVREIAELKPVSLCYDLWNYRLPDITETVNAVVYDFIAF